MALGNIMTIDIFKALKETDIKNLLIVFLYEIKICMYKIYFQCTCAYNI